MLKKKQTISHSQLQKSVYKTICQVSIWVGGIEGYVIWDLANWPDNWLIGCKIVLMIPGKVNDCFPDWMIVTSGILQGSVVRPSCLYFS